MNIEAWRTYFVAQRLHGVDRGTPAVVEAALDGDVDAVQLREKGTDARTRYRLGVRLRELTDEAGAALIVNDRIDLARAVAADGVHLGQSDLPVEVARDQLGPEAIVGCSTSTVREAEIAVDAGADYLGVGAVYGTTSKDVADGKDGIGPERVAAITDAVDVPVIGIGGIDADNADRVAEAGAAGVAVISAIAAADDPEAAARELRETVVDAR